MTIPQPLPPSPGPAQGPGQGPILRELLGLTLLLLGAAAVVTAAFWFDVRAGVAATGLVAIAGGLVLTNSEV